jgi:aminoacyl tRNA synthase complex-interacting multifunctional protein 1
MKGFESQGMVLCAKSETKVEFVSVPEGSKNGDRITLEDQPLGEFEPLGPSQVKRKKVWEAIALTLKTDADRVACSDGKKLVDARGVACIAPTVVFGVVS